MEAVSSTRFFNCVFFLFCFVFLLLLRLFGQSGLPLPCDGESLEAGGNAVLFDLTQDGSVDLGDSLFLLNYLVGAGPAPAGGVTCQRVEGCPNLCFF